MDNVANSASNNQLSAKRENDRERHSTGFLIKQRAFLHLHMITMTEENRLYGLRLLEVLQNDFRAYGYKPQHSEVYKALHDLLEEGILEQVVRIKEGKKRQKVMYYQFKDKEKAYTYKNVLLNDISRCIRLLEKSYKSNNK